MNKLTKEQADILIANIKNSICLTDRPDDRYVHGLKDCFNNVEKIISQCTEKAFPAFASIDTSGDAYNFELEGDKVYLINEFNLQFEKKDFMIFAEAVNKIVEFLNES